MKKWEEIAPATLRVMEQLGDFGPLSNPQEPTVKGWWSDREGTFKAYWSSDKLRTMAAAFIEVANWLDARAKAATPAPEEPK